MREIKSFSALPNRTKAMDGYAVRIRPLLFSFFCLGLNMGSAYFAEPRTFSFSSCSSSIFCLERG